MHLELYDPPRRVGKITQGLLTLPIVTSVWLLPGIIAFTLVGFGHFFWSLLAYCAFFFMAMWCFRRLVRRWPSVFGSAAVKGGPRLTISRVVVLCGAVLLPCSVLGYLYLSLSLGITQMGIACCVWYVALLFFTHSMERRWSSADDGGINPTE